MMNDNETLGFPFLIDPVYKKLLDAEIALVGTVRSDNFHKSDENKKLIEEQLTAIVEILERNEDLAREFCSGIDSVFANLEACYRAHFCVIPACTAIEKFIKLIKSKEEENHEPVSLCFVTSVEFVNSLWYCLQTIKNIYKVKTGNESPNLLTPEEVSFTTEYLLEESEKILELISSLTPYKRVLIGTKFLESKESFLVTKTDVLSFALLQAVLDKDCPPSVAESWAIQYFTSALNDSPMAKKLKKAVDNLKMKCM